MAFDPSLISVSNNAGAYPSNTRFEITTDRSLQVTSDGDPYPAYAAHGSGLSYAANRTFRTEQDVIKEQRYNYKFVYRAGQKTQAPQKVVGSPTAIMANGVTVVYPNKTSIPECEAVLPSTLQYDSVYFEDKYGADPAGGYPNSSGAYNYYTGAFITAWQNDRFVNAAEYYSGTNYEGDNFRHADGHSKILGYCFDGYPIYGPYGYQNPMDKFSVVERMESGYKKLLNDAHRPNGFKSDNVIYIDEVETPLELGVFVQDYVYRESAGDLDKHNGRYCITPDYPEGTYAYFITTNKTDGRPTYPYIIGTSTKQNREFVTAPAAIDPTTGILQLWSVSSGTIITTLEERRETDIQIPLANNVTIDKVEIISGQLAPGLRIVGNRIVGTVYEVVNNSRFRSVLRAWSGDIYEDKTIDINVVGPDDPQWITQEGLLPVGNNGTLFILDSAYLDFQFEATDTDLSAGDTLRYYIPEGGGVLPPGITLSEEGKLTGIIEPLLALDKRYEGGGYDNQPYGDIPIDYGIPDANGYSSYYYDSETFDLSVPTVNLKKLNRYYPLTIAVTDGLAEVKRDFTLYVVGDDFLKADNTIMKAGTGVFTADNTNVRNPIWLTPADLGFKRANNYTTINLDIIDNPTLEGIVRFTLESVNDDGTKSTLPPGLELDKNTGELTGIIPYQPAITIPYKFTVRATRITSDIDLVTIFGTFYEDTLLGNSSFKIGKVDLTGNADGVDDLFDLIGRDILLENVSYKVINVDSRNEDYDIIFLDDTLRPSVNLILSRTAEKGSQFFFVNRLTEANKTKYENRELRFAGNQVVRIDTIEDYIEYEIKQQEPFTDPIYPRNVPQALETGTNYFVGEIVYGPDTKIYKCINSHSYSSFIASNWQEIGETITDLPLDVLANATKHALDREFGGDSIVNPLETNRWHVTIKSTAITRVKNNIIDFFMPAEDSGILQVNVIKDYEQRIGLDVGLPLQLNAFRNIGIALFRRGSFQENLVVTQQEDIDIPSTTKTFTVKVLGEVESTINWITPADLGTVRANYNTNKYIEAETNVVDTPMLYKIVSGRLPNGMRLSIDGQLIGAANQFGTQEDPGLIRWTDVPSWDGTEPGDTTFDRQYKFTVEAYDRFGYSAIQREFSLTINDLDEKLYTDIYAKPFLSQEQKTSFKNFISDSTVFIPESIYRASDPEFGLQKDLEFLIYAGIEAKDTQEFVAAAAKNHKRKKYIPGTFKKAIAKTPGTNDEIYEVIYLELIDPAEPKKGNTRKKFNIRSTNKITVDSIEFAAKDDETKTGLGYDALPLYTRQAVKFQFITQDKVVVETRDSSYSIDAEGDDFTLEIRDSSDVTVKLIKSDSEPTRIRPVTTTIKADSDAINADANKDVVKYISNITNMRDNIAELGTTERLYLPLWMRTPQDDLRELDYVLAIPVCYCKPGKAETILRNINNSGFDPKTLNIDIDRYIVKRTNDKLQEQYILFANYQFNV